MGPPLHSGAGAWVARPGSEFSNPCVAVQVLGCRGENLHAACKLHTPQPSFASRLLDLTYLLQLAHAAIMVNFPKELKSYCRHEQCKNHQDWRVSQYKVRSWLLSCGLLFHFVDCLVVPLFAVAPTDVFSFQAGKASLFAQGKRRYDRKQAGFGGQVRRFTFKIARPAVDPQNIHTWQSDQARLPQEGQGYQENHSAFEVQEMR